jgi:hypothetical protein
VKGLAESPDPFCLHIAVSNLYFQLGKFFFLCHHKGIAHRLGLVDKDRFLQLPDIHIDTLDLIDHDTIFLPEDPVRTPLDLQ